MAVAATDSASAGAMARYERRLRTMTRTILLTNNRRTALGLVAARARQAAHADLAAVYVRSADGDDVVFSTARRWSSARLSALGPTSALAARFLGGALSKPRLIDIPDGGLGPAMVTGLACPPHIIRGALLVARKARATPFKDADLTLIAPFCAEARLAVTFAEARRELERGLLAEDRNRIARELHDGVIQSLYGIGLVIEGIRGEAVRPSVNDQLSGLTESINLLIDDLRAYINDLTPTRLAERGLGPELSSLAREFQASTGMIATVRLTKGVDEIGAELGRDLVQIAREALANVAKHAAASRVVLSLRCSSHTVRLEIADDGRGMAPNHSRGRGLLNILRRVQAWEGNVEIGPLHGIGTAVKVSVPVRPGHVSMGRTAARTSAVSGGLAIAG